MEIKQAEVKDIDNWMQLVEKVKASFPGLETAEALEQHRQTALDFFSRKAAICAITDNRIAGALLFSKDENMLCFLAVDPDYRRQGIAKQLVYDMLKHLDSEKNVVVTTYREGEPEGMAARAFYKHLGFTEGRLTEEFGSPVQEFILIR